MYTLEIENSKGEKLSLTNNPAYTIISIDGLYPPNANINLSKKSSDGAIFNSSVTNERNIVIELCIESPAELNRINLYKYVRSKSFIRLYYKNSTRDVFIDGYVENMPIQLFENKQKAQISIICPEPYFNDVTDIVQNGSYTTPLFEFPMSIAEEGIELSTYDAISTIVIDNESDVDIGMVIKIAASGDVVNPRIHRRDNLDSIGLNFTMQDGDLIEISTVPGDKYAKLYRDGEETNIINKLMASPTWFILTPGDNLFTYEAESGTEAIDISFYYRFMYEGV